MKARFCSIESYVSRWDPGIAAVSSVGCSTTLAPLVKIHSYTRETPERRHNNLSPRHTQRHTHKGGVRKQLPTRMYALPIHPFYKIAQYSRMYSLIPNSPTDADQDLGGGLS